MAAIGADVRRSYESEAGRLTVSVANLDGHVEQMRDDVVQLRGKVTGAVETIDALTRGLVTSVDATAASLEQRCGSVASTEECANEFRLFVREKMKDLKGMVQDLGAAKVCAC